MPQMQILLRRGMAVAAEADRSSSINSQLTRFSENTSYRGKRVMPATVQRYPLLD
jgi:hypothetical protein